MKEQNNKGGKEMINTKELTIGCYVKVNGKPHKVDEVFANAVGVEWDTLFHYSDLEPIPITKELLLKNGFEELKQGKDKYHNCIAYVFGDCIHLYNHEKGWKLIIDNEKLWIEWEHIKYVHQLQTLCNVLGIDLELEL